MSNKTATNKPENQVLEVKPEEVSSVPEETQAVEQPAVQKPNTEDTLKTILAEINKRDKVIERNEKTILELMKDRVSLAARLDDALNQLSRATQLNVSLGRESYNTIYDEYKTYEARVTPKDKEGKTSANN